MHAFLTGKDAELREPRLTGVVLTFLRISIALTFLYIIVHNRPVFRYCLHSDIEKCSFDVFCEKRACLMERMVYDNSLRGT